MTASAFLGFAKVNLIHQASGDPTIKAFELQREVQTRHVNALFELGDGGSGKNLRREDPETAMVFLVNSGYIQQSSLVQSVSGPFKEVKYTPEAKGKTIRLVDGCHRWEVVKKLMKGILERLEKLREKDVSKMDGDSRIEHDKEVASLEQVKKERGFWLVKFYDAGEYLCLFRF